MHQFCVRTLAIIGLFFSTVHSTIAQNVIAWGSNASGQTDVPASATNVIAVAAGWKHSLALRNDGTVISWGSITNVPPEATNVVAIAAGALHNLVLKADGKIWAWGDNRYGQSVNSGWSGLAAIAAGDYFSVAIFTNNIAHAWGLNASVMPANLRNVTAISAGSEHCITTFTDKSFTAWAFGFQSWQAGNVQPPLISFTNILGVFAGSTNNLALRADGTVKPWGTKKQPVVPSYVSNVVTVALSTNCNLALRSDGTIAAWGSGIATNVPLSATNVVAVAAGLSHGLAITGDGAPRFFGAPGYLESVSVSDHLPLTARVVGSSPLHLQWLADGVPIPDATNLYPKIRATLGTDNVSYQVVASNQWGCITGAVSKVKVNAVKVWGDNANKQRIVPESFTNAVAIAAGVAHVVGLRSDGSVTAWGRNANQTNTSDRVRVPRAATNVVAIAAGSDHSLALRANGSIVAWGYNYDGQTNVPISLTNIMAIDAGWAHSLALQSNGQVVAWGNNEYNQTNIPTYAKDVIAIAAGYYHNLALKWDGSVIAWGNDEESLVPASATNVIAIAAGWEHSMALRADGRVIAWGDNSYGQADVPASATNVIALAAGYYHSLALRRDGTVIGWGKGYFGVINIPGALSSVSSIAAGEDFSVALVKVGPPVFTPSNATVTAHVNGRTLLTTTIGGTQPLSFQWFLDGVAVSDATNHFLVLEPVQPSDAGTYTLVVTNASGETNSFLVNVIVDSAPYFVPPSGKQTVLPYTPLILTATIQGVEPMTFQWRRNGTNLSDGDRFSGVNQRVLQINNTEFDDSGDYQMIVSNSAASVTGLVSRVNVTPVIAWGENFSGQTDVPFGTTNIAAISAGGKHSLALTLDGSVIAWGDNTFGQTNIPPTATNVISISAGNTHNLALRSNGTVVAWGDNRYGQCDVPLSATNLIAIAAGGDRSLGVRSNGTITAWRYDVSSETITNIVAIDAGFYSFIALRKNGTAWNGYSVVPGWTNLVAVATGFGVELGLSADGTVYSWFFFQWNLSIPKMNTIAISAGDYHALTLDADGTVRGWGDTYAGEAQLPESTRNVTAISAGGAHNLALVQVSTNLQFIAHPANHSVTLGESVNLNASATGRGPVRYQWFLNDSPVGSATNTTLTFTTDVSRAGEYFVVASNPWSSITSAVVTVSIPGAPTITLHPQSQTVASGTTVLLNAEVQGTSPLSLQWQFAGAPLTGETTSQLQLLSVTPAHSGYYSLQATNSFGTATSTPAWLKVIVPSEITLNFSEGSPLLSFDGTTGASYLIQYTTNIASSNWLDLITLSNPSASFQFIDTNISSNGTRFYRAIGN